VDAASGVVIYSGKAMMVAHSAGTDRQCVRLLGGAPLLPVPLPPARPYRAVYALIYAFGRAAPTCDITRRRSVSAAARSSAPPDPAQRLFVNEDGATQRCIKFEGVF